MTTTPEIDAAAIHARNNTASHPKPATMSPCVAPAVRDDGAPQIDAAAIHQRMNARHLQGPHVRKLGTPQRAR
jgi:hypothetical protein